MGIAKGALSLLFELKTEKKFKGVACQLGRQTTYITPIQFQTIGKSFGFNVNELKHIEFEDSLNPGMISDNDLFTELGFETIESIDYSDYENPTHVLDLNIPVSEEFYNRYDFIYDGGTLEHVFNFPQCLKNIYFMLKPGGMIIHASPSHNHVDHGFYMFSPTVFYDYYFANKYEIVKSYVFEYESKHNTRPWLIYKYEPGILDSRSYGGWGRKMLGIWFVAQKTSESTCEIIPQQNLYLRVWANSRKSINQSVNRNLDITFKEYLKNI